MKAILLRATALMVLVTFWQTSLYAAGESGWASASDQVEAPQDQPERLQTGANPFQDEDPLAPGNAGDNPEGCDVQYQDSCAGDSCFGGCCLGGCFGSCCEGAPPTCEQRPRLGLVGLFGFDTFHGFSEGDYQSKFGAVMGLNAGGPLPGLDAVGIGWQIGSTFGVYDWDGRATGIRDAQSMQQVFVTAGFFRKPACGRLSLGVVYDWMIANNWGTFAVSPTLGQWRGQAEYAFSDFNGVGVWGTIADRSHTQQVFNLSIVDRAVDQIDFFWHHKFCSGADSWLWMGIPDHAKLDEHGSLGEFIIGGGLQVPIGERLAVYGNMQYMRPTAAAGADASRLQTYDLGVGVVWYPGRNAHTATVNGSCWTPYMPIGNNANFLVDQNRTL